jgi:hypothetical protein
LLGVNRIEVTPPSEDSRRPVHPAYNPAETVFFSHNKSANSVSTAERAGTVFPIVAVLASIANRLLRYLLYFILFSKIKDLGIFKKL